MTGRVALYPPQLPGATTTANRVRIAAPVYGGGQWNEFGALTNWLIGRGSPLVMCGPTGGVAVGNDLDNRFYIWPHEQNYARLWNVMLYKRVTGSGAAYHGFASIDIDSVEHVASVELEDHWLPYVPKVVSFVQIISPASGTAGGVTLTVSNDGPESFSPDIYVGGISCYEIPRNTLADFGSVVVPDLDTLASGQQIYDPADDSSVPAVMRASVDALTQARRACLLSVAYPDGVTITDASFDGTTNIFTTSGANDPPVVARHLHSGQTFRDVAFAVYAVADAATGGELSVTSTNPSGTSIEQITNVADWVTGVIAVDTEDLSQAGGLRGGVRNPIIAEARILTGTTNVTVYSYCMGEPQA